MSKVRCGGGGGHCRIATIIIVCLFVTGQHIAVVCGQGNLDSLLGSVFTTPPPGVSNVLPPGGQVPFPTQTPRPTSLPATPPPAIGCPVGSECVPFYLCSDNNTIITNGEAILDIRFDDEPKACNDYLTKCCNYPDQVQDPLIPPIVHEEPLGCGFRNTEGVGFRITGASDNEAQYAEFPWMVAVLKEERAHDQTLNVYQCGGALIHPSVVLTAAHCVQNKAPASLKVRAGEWDTQTKNELYPHQDRDVVDIVIHPGFYKGALYNDIALLFLNEPVNNADNVGTVCLPPQDYVFDHTRCFASGWGKDVFGKEGRYQVILKRVELPIVANTECERLLRTTRLSKFFQLHKSFICAGGEANRDTCKGDGGSPLVCPIPGQINRYFQAGIVAWGIGCGENQVPGVYARVSLFRNWIDEQLTFKRLDPSPYSA